MIFIKRTFSFLITFLFLASLLLISSVYIVKKTYDKEFISYTVNNVDILAKAKEEGIDIKTNFLDEMDIQRKIIIN